MRFLSKLLDAQAATSPHDAQIFGTNNRAHLPLRVYREAHEKTRNLVFYGRIRVIHELPGEIPLSGAGKGGCRESLQDGTACCHRNSLESHEDP